MKRTNNLRHERVTERARAITNMKKAKARKQRIILSTVAIVLVAVTASCFMIFGAANAKPQTADTAPTSVTKVLTAEKTAANADKTTAETAQTAAQNNTAAQTAAAAQTTYAQPADTQQTAQQTAQQPTQQQSQDRIDNINGERVYIDTKRPAPQNGGTPAHYYANGKTSYGFDWNYDADNSCFMLRCDYNFNQQQYDFQFYGVTPGTAHVTLYYFTADNVKVPVSLTVNVDSNLNVTVG